MAATVFAPRVRDTAMADMNVTPLVDVMLVMLVIFMITAPALTHTLPMKLPAPGPQTPPPTTARLHVDAIGGFELDGRRLDAAGLRPALAQLARVSPDTVLHVSAAADSEYQGFASALAAAQDSGLEHIALDD